MSDYELARKLGLKSGYTVCFVHAPKGYEQRLSQPDLHHHSTVLGHDLNWVQAFYTTKASLEQEILALKDSLSSTGQLWLCWPKRTSRVPSDLDDSTVREIGLATGLVDVKVAAIDSVWSGLKFVYRLTDRAS